MCTAVSWKPKDHYFGRTLDLEYGLGEQIIVTPRYYPLTFRHLAPQEKHYAFIGMAVEAEGTALYFDAVNEMGLCMAALNFPGCARYHSPSGAGYDVASFELIPWLLGQCASLFEAKKLLERCNIISEPFSAEFPPTPLHWLLADDTGSLVIESVPSGTKVYEGVGVLTNAPEYPKQREFYNVFRHLTNCSSETMRGSGSLGMPGDFSSQGRFVRAGFARNYCVCGNGEDAAVEQFFHILDIVAQPKGCVKLPDGQMVCTQYASCCNADKGIYYYVTATNRRICAVDLHSAGLKGDRLISYPLNVRPDFCLQNR